MFYLLKNFVKRFMYSYYCPVCGKGVRKFLPLPEHYQERLRGYGYTLDDFETLNYEHYSCPHCLATDRDRLYSLFINNILDRDVECCRLKMLEIAPFAPLGNMIRNTGKFDLRTADKNMRGVDDCVDITDMQIYGDSSFDSFICSHVLEHVADDVKALRELYRILKPSGWGIIMVPILLTLNAIDEDPSVCDEDERWRRFGQDDHVRMYSRGGFLSRVEQTGFKTSTYGCDYFGKHVFRKCGIDSKSVIYVVSK